MENKKQYTEYGKKKFFAGNLHQEMIGKLNSGEELNVDEFMMYWNPAYAEYRRCGAMPEDMEFKASAILRFAEDYHEYKMKNK